MAYRSRSQLFPGSPNARQIATPSGKPWSAVTVLRVQRRLEGL
jgi:hypothetical protein